MGERRNSNGSSYGEHVWAQELLGPYVLGALDAEEEKAVKRHLDGCTACQDEERKLRRVHERFAGASIAASSAPPYLKARVLAGLPRRGRESWAARGIFRMAAAVVVLLLALAAVAYSAGFLDRTAQTATLAPTELAPEAGGDLKMRDSGQEYEASLDVWGLPQTGPNEYYELWFGMEEGRVSVGTFTVDDRGRGRLSTICPDVAGDYQRAGITLERFPEEPSMEDARVVLRGDLQES